MRWDSSTRELGSSGVVIPTPPLSNKLVIRKTFLSTKTKPMNKKTTIVSLGIILFLALSNLAFSSEKSKGKNAVDQSIESVRKGTIVLTGKPGSTVKVEQLKHEFWFGAAIASGVFEGNTRLSEKEIAVYKEKFLENFNAAVTENAVKWGNMERKRGDINYTTADNIAQWTAENNIPCRGHNLYWGIDKFVQSWVKDLNDDELRAALKKRGVETARHFKGKFVEYDLNNEMVHGNYYEKRLGYGITKEMADWVLTGDKSAKLWLNDYDILTGNRLDDYMAQIRKFIKQGVPIAGIGVQGHLHTDTFSREKLKEALDSLAQFGLPIRITEFNIPGQRSKYYKNRSLKMTSEEELEMAKELTDYYRICFAHPAVEGILMWGFWESSNWIPQSSLYRTDWSATPALEAYQKLIFEEWNTETTVKLDKNGKAEIPAFYGDYKITIGKKEVFISLKKDEGSKKVDVKNR